MKYEDLLARSRALTPEETADMLRQLVAHPAFAAVLRKMDDARENWADSTCQNQFANAHGTLAHAAGARCAYKQFEGFIREACAAKKLKGEAPPEE